MKRAPAPAPASTFYRLPELKTRKGDLTKHWYVEYYAWDTTLNQGAGGLARQTKYCPAKYKTADERKRWGNSLIATITKLFEDGYYKLKVKEPVPIIIPPPTPIQRVSPDIITAVAALELIVVIKESAYRTRTGESYRNVLRRFVDSLEHYGNADLLLSQTTARHIYEFSDYIIYHRKLSSRYRNNLIEGLRTIFDELIDREYIAKNPAAKVKSLPVQTSRKNLAFTHPQRSEFETFLRQHDPTLFTYTRFIYQAFVRPVELMRLQVRDIELIENRIAFPPSISKGGSRKQFTEYVEITPSLRQVIVEMNLDRFPPTHYLFSQNLLPGRQQIARNRVSERHHDALVAAGMYNGELTLYSWKHTGVVNAYKVGASIDWLQRHLRHSDMRDTVIYLKSLGLMLEKKSIAPSW
ncbi:tyrosine-type recombinase/integrase [Spirosoma telluris]|uniref:tyrosine-type recombinase/integrase n=1 Tax=Spirosoma telluris TaxID=2183553 RepID=UPI0013142F51